MKTEWLTICLIVNCNSYEEILFAIAYERQLSRCSVYGR
jgi:hypothetical protein